MGQCNILLMLLQSRAARVFREFKTALIPAVTHVDGSGRLQTAMRMSRWCASPSRRSTALMRAKMDVLVSENTLLMCQQRS